jgi:excisionase family DNA binding protein
VSIEETIREIVHDEVRKAVAEVMREMPIPIQHGQANGGLSVKEAARILGVGVSKVYELTRRPGFPAIRDGWKIIIPAHGLYRWMEEEAFRNDGSAMAR